MSIKDATAIQKHLVTEYKINNVEYSLADVNYDGVVNIRDTTALQQTLGN